MTFEISPVRLGGFRLSLIVEAIPKESAVVANELYSSSLHFSDREPPQCRLLNVKEAANHLGVSVSFLNKARLSQDGPVFVKLGTRVAYDPNDLSAWLAERKRTSTASNVRAGGE